MAGGRVGSKDKALAGRAELLARQGNASAMLAALGWSKMKEKDMGWNNIEPHIPAQKATVRVGVVKIGAGEARGSVSFTRAMMDKLGNPDRVDVFIGDGDEDGMLLLEFGAHGDHQLRKLPKGAAKISVAQLGGGMPKQACKPRGVRFEEIDADNGCKQLTISLPW